MVATLDASPALSAYERELHHEAVATAERGPRRGLPGGELGAHRRPAVGDAARVGLG